MSLMRLVYYSAVIGGWAAFLGWIVAETMFFRSAETNSAWAVAAVGGIIGGAVGVGINVVAGMASAQWKRLLKRAVPGLLLGALGGLVGATLGNMLFLLHLPRALGWMVMGLGIGVVDGAYERSGKKIRNGLIGGFLGGLVGGFLFDLVQGPSAAGLEHAMSSRAIGFVVLGIAIGAMIGSVQVVLREAWLTVLDGYRSGRQLILSQNVTMLGRGDHLPLPFLGPPNRDLESEHLKITRQANGGYMLEDNHSRLGTRLNGLLVTGPVPLCDGDVIKFGTNYVRFNQRKRRSGDDVAAAPSPGAPASASAATVSSLPPPPPKPKKPAARPIPEEPGRAVTGNATPAPPRQVLSPREAPAPPPAPSPAPPPAPGPSRSSGLRPPPPPPRPKKSD